MTEVELEVTEAYPNDTGRAIARLDPDTMGELGLNPGDVIEVEGNETTAAKIWRADRQDWNGETIRLDGFTRQNADIGLAERVTIRKAEAETAERVVLSPPDEASVQFRSDAAGMVKRQILKRPVTARDIVPVMSSTNHPFMRSPGQAIPLIAVEADPEGVVLVTEDTSVALHEEPLEAIASEQMEQKERPRTERPVAPTPPLRATRTTVPENLCLHEVSATVERIDVEGIDTQATDRRQVTVEGTIENVSDTRYERVEAGVTFFENSVGTVHLDRREAEARAFAPGHTWTFALSYHPRTDRLPRSYDLVIRTAE